MRTLARTVVKHRRSHRVPVPQDIPARVDREECPRCSGTGRRGGEKFATHRAECGCVGCRPCRNCSGSGRVEVPRAARKLPEVTRSDEFDDEEG